MSNALAIAAVTATLRQRLERVAGEELGGGLVTTLPLDQVRKNFQDKNQINIYLYQAVSNPAWSNRNVPIRTKPGETGPQPLALNLFYLITPYSADTSFLSDHKLLGLIMQTLNDYPILGSKEIEEAFPDSNLQHQVEKVRLIQIDLSLEDMSRVWSTCQTEYRLSVAYEASVVLIFGPRPIKTPLPVLTVNTDSVRPNLTLPQVSIPTLEQITLPEGSSSIELGGTLILRGHNLRGDDNEIRVILEHPRINDPIEIIPQPNSSNTEIQVRLDETRNDWLAGIYTVKIKIKQNHTNSLPLFFSPSIDLLPIQNNIIDNRQLRLQFNPRVLLWQKNEQLLQGQSVFLLVGDRELSPDIRQLSSTPNNRTNTLIFDLSNLEPGQYFVRLRVDGIDSPLIDRSVNPPRFNSDLQLEIE
ncbi:DUF4255 domain-containing protein [Crocosphaera sp.]|uniref:DUF4255 domain-containing protein n=1 Tax=Crocosphaera sp. TaxID=2729996 RepID=UPI002629AE18|nr:DUF4255 domain-containing protein [Crocosphaera sp.]MDJ0582127.1 DUF4255 domain-containing protein [Crocosphaera sp.]